MNLPCRTVCHVLILLMLSVTIGCITTGTTTEVTSGQGGPSIQEAQMEAYNGPKARIAVAQFKDKTGHGQRWWSSQIGDGMADQLVTALFNTNRFIVLERQTLDHVLTEQDLGASGRVSQQTAAPIGQIEGAELLVVGAVTEFEGNASGARGGVGGGGGGILGALVGGFKRSHMAIDMRIIDSRTSRILAATSVEGSATDVNMGGLLGGYGSAGVLVGGLQGWKNTPTEKSLRICIQKAVEFIVSKTPARYYRSGGSAQPAAAPAVKKVQPAAQTTGLSKSVIRQMQSYLASLGYAVGKPDGIPGRKTRAAVSAFQEDYGLPVNGQLDPATMKKLREVAGE